MLRIAERRHLVTFLMEARDQFLLTQYCLCLRKITFSLICIFQLSKFCSCQLVWDSFYANFQIYIELLGKEKQPDNVPQKIYLQVRHLSGSYFRAGDDTIKQFHLPVGSFKNIKFDRFTLSNVNKCKGRKSKGKNPSKLNFNMTSFHWYEIFT